MTTLRKKAVSSANSKVITMFRPTILSRHPSHNCLRLKHKHIQPLPYRSVIRFGSTTEVEDTVAKGGKRIEVNSIQAIKNSASKLLMKEKFTSAEVKTAKWFRATSLDNLITQARTLTNNWESKLVAKAFYGSKGRGNTLISSEAELRTWFALPNSALSTHLFELFMNFGHEFRLHVTEEGCFYACRKALKQDVPEDQKWRRHDDICVWFLEENESFFKPNSWSDIEADCIKALKAVGADLLSFDVRVQSPTDGKGNRREYQDFILLECNSASSMDNGTGELSICAKKYIEEIPKIIMRKARQ